MKATFDQIAETYHRMADVFECVQPTAAEVERFAERWIEQEDSCEFYIGCCDFRTRPATIFAIEAAHQMCTGDWGNDAALELLKMAVKELESLKK